jgi:replication initiation protein RepC
MRASRHGKTLLASPLIGGSVKDTGCAMIGTIIKPYVDERARWRPKPPHSTTDRRLTKAELTRLYVRAARKLGHGQADQRFHLELIRLSKPADYAEGRSIVLAHSNSFLEVRCGMSRSALGRQLRKHDGETLVRTLSGNGHRFIARRRSEASDGEIVEACGVSLEPLMVLLINMAPIIDAEDELQMRLDIAKARIGRDRRRQRAVLGLLDGEKHARAAMLEAESREMAAAISSAFANSRLAELEGLAAKVALISDQIDEIASAEGVFQVHDRTPQGSGCGHLLPIRDPQYIESVEAGEKAETLTGVADEPSLPKWTPRQLKSTFPGLAMYVAAPDPFWMDIDRGSARLASDLGINSRCWARARTEMGAEQRYVAIALVAELMANGRVKTTAGQYFGGMLNKARRGQLDLNRSVWAHRQRSRPIAVVGLSSPDHSCSKRC